MMQMVFSDEQFPTEVTKSLFLEGPSPRDNSHPDWKVEAENILRDLQFDGTVFVPVPRHRFYSGTHDTQSWTYEGQIEWEVKARQRADVIVCYLDRKIDVSDSKNLGMPGFTTNIEFGEDLHSGKLVYGRPDSADKVRYADLRVTMQGLPVHTGLVRTLAAAVNALGKGAARSGGEVAVPLFIWNTPQFQDWYQNVKAAGNRLDDAKVLFHARFKSGPVFTFILWTNIWVAAEMRHKSNEFMVSRNNISCVVAHHTDVSTGKKQVVLVKEFRSPVSNKQGMVFELPGGSSPKPGTDPRVNAQHELDEEVGLFITDATRFRPLGTRQLVATLLTHQAQVYSIALTDTEMAQLQAAANANKVFGEEGTSELTYVVISDVTEIHQLPLDYATLGMIFEAIYC